MSKDIMRECNREEGPKKRFLNHQSLQLISCFVICILVFSSEPSSCHYLCFLPVFRHTTFFLPCHEMHVTEIDISAASAFLLVSHRLILVKDRTSSQQSTSKRNKSFAKVKARQSNNEMYANEARLFSDRFLVDLVG